MTEENVDNRVVTEELLFRPRMKPNTPGKLKYGRTFLIGLAFFCSSLAWNYYNFIMPILLKDYYKSMGIVQGIDTSIGIVMILDNIIAILLLPIFGALSDKTRSKFGKRMPYIIIGTTSAIIAFSVIGLLSHNRGVAAFVGFIAVVMWFNFSMAFFRSASVSLMPDLTDPEVRSTGNAIINLMGAFAMVIALAGPTIMKMFFDIRWIPEENKTRAGGFYYVSILTALALLILFLTIKETPTGKKFMEIADHPIAVDPISLEYIGENVEGNEKKETIWQSLKAIFTEKEKSAVFMLLVIFTWFLGYNAMDTYYSLYATQYMGWEEASASQALMIAPVTMIITAVFSGKIAEKIGRKRTIFIGLIGLSITVFIMMFMKSFPMIVLMIAIIGIFYGMININTIVIIWQMAPKGKLGTYTGAYYFFSQMSATIGPLAAGATFDLYKIITHPVEGAQYFMLFPYLIFWELIAMIFLSRVKRGEAKSFTKKQIDELRDKYEED
ncbi:MAG: MFS transporter [Candidatus Lokiarchaeota archaeon]|nr:MFS transporter [Candidatus Harpocratesius repetitus]